MRKKKIGKVLLIACMLMVTWLLSPQSAQAATLVDSGTCGTNLKWYVYNDGNLVINGSGEMNDYKTVTGLTSSVITSGPWGKYADTVKTVSIGEGVTSIGSYAFLDMKSIKEIAISSTVVDIGEGAFKNCILIEEIIIPNNVETIGEAAFENCISLEQVYLSGQITDAPKLFYGCTSLKEVAMPKRMSEISDFMFYGCTSLEEIWVDETVTAVGNYAFANCSEFRQIRYDSEVANIEAVGSNAFENCVTLLAVIGSESIGSDAYKGCRDIQEVNFNGSSLGAGAFSNCVNLEKAVIGENVPVIRSKTFQNDTYLSFVRIKGENTEIADATVFNGCSSDLEIQVPEANTQVVNYLKENGIKRYESVYGEIGDIDIPLVGFSEDVRWMNSNHCTFYTGNVCSTVGMKTEGEAIGSSLYAKPEEIIIYYSDSENLTEDNYTSFPTSVTTKATVGFQKSYAYGEYVDLGVMYCAIAKAEPVLELQNVTLNEGKTKSLNLSVKGSPVISYQSTKPTVATISSTGKITAKKAGTTTIRVFVAPTKNYRAIVKEFTVTVKAVKKQTITASNKSVVYKCAPFNLNAKASGGGKLTYTSSNKKVATVSTTGKVTVKGYGKTTITIKAAANGTYLAATKTITVTVKPKKMTLKSVSSPGKKKLNISWTKDSTVTGYEVQFSTKKNFSSNTYKRTFAVSKTSTKLTGVPSKKTYYVRIRAYKTVNGTKYYGAWSALKSVKVK